MSTDPFGTAALRRAVLRSWDELPARFREDANAEELLSHGYRSRVVAELAANGADAARAAGQPGHLAIGVVDGTLRVANTGAPLTADGVMALAALRASAKRDEEAVGHFGVGFTAVRAIGDEIVVASTTGSIRFSAVQTAAAAAALGNSIIDAELARRGGVVPALRLPWSCDDERAGGEASDEWPGWWCPTVPDASFVTEVRVSLRDRAAEASWTDDLTVAMAEDLLWALPELASVSLPDARVERRDEAEGMAVVTVWTASDGDHAAPREPVAQRRYRTVSTAGTVPADVLSARPTEERGRTSWRVTWILPAGDEESVGGPQPIGAPLPTEELLDLPARLVASLPVDETRSRLAPGPLTDFLLDRAADGYVDLVMEQPPAARIALIPPAGFPVGDADAALRTAVGDRLSHTAFLPAASGADTSVMPGDAVMVPGLAGVGAALVGHALPGLIAWPPSGADVERLRGLGAAVVGFPEVTAALAGLDRPVDFWRGVYDALADVPADDLRDLPIPRLGGGLLIGARGVLLPSGPAGDPVDDPVDSPAPGARSSALMRAAKQLPALRLAAIGAHHPLLLRLGAEPADAGTVLASSALAEAIGRAKDAWERDESFGDDGDADRADAGADFARMVLDLVAEAEPASIEATDTDDSALVALILTDQDGEPWPAGDLFLPDAPILEVMAGDVDPPLVASEWIEDYGVDLLSTIGVRSGFAAQWYPMPPDRDTELDDVDRWWAEVGEAGEKAVALHAGPSDSMAPGQFCAVPDLDLIDDDAWPQALLLLLTQRQTRRALRPLRTAWRPFPSYTSWWLRRHALIDGAVLGSYRAADAHELAGLYDPLPLDLSLDLPDDLAREVGVLTSIEDAMEDPACLLSRWADPARTLTPYQVSSVTAAVAAAVSGETDVELPEVVRVLSGAVVSADNACVLDRPDLAQVLDPVMLIAGGEDPRLVADALYLPLASESFSVEVVLGPRAGDTVTLGSLPAATRAMERCARWDLADVAVRVDPDLAVVVRPSDGDDSIDVPDGVDIGDRPRRVSWWRTDDGPVLDGSAAGIGRLIAVLADRWRDRHLLVAAAAGDPSDAVEFGLEP